MSSFPIILESCPWQVVPITKSAVCQCGRGVFYFTYDSKNFSRLFALERNYDDECGVVCPNGLNIIGSLN